MVLNDEQCMRFFDTMDSLLYYVNDRFRVVENFTLDYTGQLGDMKTALVARTLWDNVEVIDDFVRSNPAHLPQRCLDTALAWKAALPGLYTVVRYQAGRALMMNDAGVFSVCGVTNELEGEIGKAPAYVDLVLLPFDDLIVYDGFLQAYDIERSSEENSQIQDEFENRCAHGIISSGSDFAPIAERLLEERRNEELEALLADVTREAADKDEELPAGYHRGTLAGLDELERVAAIAEEFAKRGMAPLTAQSLPADDPALGGERTRIDILSDQAVNCAIACTLSRGIVEIGEAYDQYRAVAPDPLERDDFDLLVRHEATFSDSYFGLWSNRGSDYLAYYTLTPDYITQTASREGSWQNLREELELFENYRAGLLAARTEVPPKPLSRTLLENSALSELLRDENVARLRRFIDERIPDGQDDYTFADLAAQEFALSSIELGSLEELHHLAEDLGILGSTNDEERLARLVSNVFNAMPSWENNGWSPQELYEQLTGRRVFYNEDATVMKLGPDDLCPCNSGKKYRDCCGR